MKCPHCKVGLIKTEKQDVAIDYCPECKGAWLDSGEIEKIMERANCPTDYEGFKEDKAHPYYRKENRIMREQEEERFDFEHKGPKKRPKRSFFKDIFK
jgi:uncharacterized protein